jgi:CDP-diacylglycerol--glycerol-3-phosphate 3-phosphatidyltransferase
MATLTPTRPSIFNLPNQLTAARFVLGVILFVLIACESWIWCLIVFSLAVVTDWLDGYLARKQGLVSTLGRNLDPLVDKVLICGAYIFLLPFGMSRDLVALAPPGEVEVWMLPWLQPWMVTLIVARELIITGLRSFMENHGASFGADWLGKIKMVLQCAALISIFVSLAAFDFARLDANRFFGYARLAFIWAMLLATALSGLQYLWRATLLLKNDW